jgi:hypothetical protein
MYNELSYQLPHCLEENMNEFFNLLLFALAIVVVSIILNPLVKTLDRISFVLQSINPKPDGISELKAYWYFFTHQNHLREVEEQSKNGQIVNFTIP